MNSRERLTRLFNNQEIDRVPIWLLFPYHPRGCYADVYNIACYKKVIEYIEKYCDTFDRRSYDTGFCYNVNTEIEQTSEIRVDGGNTYNESIVSYKDIKFTKYTARGVDGTRVKYYIEDIDDLEKILEIPYKPVEPGLDIYYKEKRELGNRGIMMLDLGDPMSPLYSLMSAEDFSISTLTSYDKILEFTDTMYERIYRYYRYMLERDIGEVFFIVGAEFAGPPLVSPDKFNEMSARYVRGLVDLIRSYGKKSIIHYHGNLYKILEGMKYINPDGLHTVEAPPIGDCTLKQARDVLGDVILIGNIQYDDLAHLEKREMQELVRAAVKEGKSGRFILSPTAGPYENHISEKMIENYITLIETGLKCGKY